MPFLITAVGFLLIFLEFYMPGALLGILGGITLVFGIFIFAGTYPYPIWVAVYVLANILLLPVLFKFTLRTIRSQSIYSGKDQEGYVASSYDKTAIGKIGVVATDLKPGGQVIVEKKKHLAISQSGYLPKGSQIFVLGGDGESLIVKLYNKENIV